MARPRASSFSRGTRCYTLYSLYGRFICGRAVPGWTSLVWVSSIIGGIQLFLVGVIGLYVGRIYDEVKGRPLCIVQGTLGLDAARQREPLALKDGPVAAALDQLD